MVTGLTHAPASIVDSSRAWLAVIGIAVANGIAFGTAYTFGTFFDAMAAEFGANRGATAVIFALTLLLFFGFGLVSGPLFDRHGPLPLIAVGGSLFVAGLLLTSVVDQLVLGYVTYGMGVGLGSGCFVAPLTGAGGALFTKRRAAALGVITTGNGLGTLILIPLSQQLIESYGWRVAYRWLAVIGLVGFVFAALTVVRPPARPTTGIQTGMTESTTDLVSDTVFRSLFGSAVFMSIGLFSAFAFIIPFATDNGVSSERAAQIFSLIGLSSIVGRLGLTGLAGRLGPIRLYRLMLVFQPVAYAIWLVAGGNEGLLVLFALVLGTTYGGFVAISPEVTITLFGTANVGRLMGLLFLSFGIGGLIGPPATGWLAEAAGQGAVIGVIMAVVIVALAASTGMANRQSQTSV